MHAWKGPAHNQTFVKLTGQLPNQRQEFQEFAFSGPWLVNASLLIFFSFGVSFIISVMLLTPDFRRHDPLFVVDWQRVAYVWHKLESQKHYYNLVQSKHNIFAFVFTCIFCYFNSFFLDADLDAQKIIKNVIYSI